MDKFREWLEAEIHDAGQAEKMYREGPDADPLYRNWYKAKRVALVMAQIKYDQTREGEPDGKRTE